MPFGLFLKKGLWALKQHMKGSQTVFPLATVSVVWTTVLWSDVPTRGFQGTEQMEVILSLLESLITLIMFRDTSEREKIEHLVPLIHFLEMEPLDIEQNMSLQTIILVINCLNMAANRNVHFNSITTFQGVLLARLQCYTVLPWGGK